MLSIDGVRAFLARQHGMEPFTSTDWFQIGITLRDTGEVVGDCGLHARDNDRRQVELGITLARSFQHRGLGSEALGALLEFLFNQQDTHRVYCSVDPRNRPCLRLLERAGMRREAHMIESLWIKGEWVDDVIFAILRSEWRGPRPTNKAPEPTKRPDSYKLDRAFAVLKNGIHTEYPVTVRRRLPRPPS